MSFRFLVFPERLHLLVQTFPDDLHGSGKRVGPFAGGGDGGLDERDGISARDCRGGSDRLPSLAGGEPHPREEFQSPVIFRVRYIS